MSTRDCTQNILGEYNLPLHIAAVFIVLITSGLGVGIPLITGRARGKDGRPAGMSDAAAVGKGEGVVRSCFFLARHFGTGIILSTSFIHLLYEGLITFANPCVGNVTYDPIAPAIALAGAFVTFVLDFVGIRQRMASLKRQSLKSNASLELSTSPNPTPNTDNKNLADSAAGGANAIAPSAAAPGLPVPAMMSGDCCHADLIFQAEQGWQVMLLEAGIIFHSIMIGVTLGADSGDSWTTLLIVIVFHQFFEGAALGARIAVLSWISKTRAFLMGLAFTIITPIGIGIGIGVRSVFSENGIAELISIGVLNSFSAGILVRPSSLSDSLSSRPSSAQSPLTPQLYTAFKLLSSDFTEGPLRDAPAWKPALAMGLMVFGMAAMAVIGKWA